MSSLFQNIQSSTQNVNSVLTHELDNPVFNSLLTIALVLYGGLAAPALPQSIQNLFNKVWFKLLIMFLIVWTASHDKVLALALAIAFYASLNVIMNKQPFELFEPSSTLVA
ncbi:uncharacterized protein BJ171DRAFT_591345 [Polychytrium aggregatum]|uniref:uncharacterized protein n=1 Tax=Polychytrium aggregatum TaxID=110093 RepID=UPI0022FE4BE5|nr:uncharacterized protein BJ171DRAFT_591345 [Polychytrium aggregatum]KAI9190675.1 hypothetical protein BJ171DRAFT_591345 [Polychytrium aggregatum]